MCTNCGQNNSISGATSVVEKRPQTLIVEKSEKDSKMVKLRYYGGRLVRNTSGCTSCASKSRYSVKTSERITFASDDAKNGIFSQEFTVSRDYFVTQKQAEYLLSLTFTNPAGQIAHKFKEME